MLGCWRPQRQLCCGAARAKQGGSGRLLAFPFNRNNALFASLQKGVSLGQRVREGGIQGGEPAGGREGGLAGDSYLAFNASPGKSRSLQNRGDFYWILEAAELSHLPPLLDSAVLKLRVDR